MAQQNSKPADETSVKQPSKLEKTKQLKHFQQLEKKALAKKDRIKTWPQEHQKEALQRVEANLSHIREEMKKLEK
jgi:hypothetical protein